MDLYVHVHGHHLFTLLDSGSTHNFINVGVIRHLQLVTSDSANMRVTVANGESVACEGVARNITLSIDREDFSISCYGIDLGVFNLVLGIDFLRTLGPFCGTRGTLPGVLARQPTHLRRGVGSSYNDVQQAAAGRSHIVEAPQQPLLDRLL